MAELRAYLDKSGSNQYQMRHFNMGIPGQLFSVHIINDYAVNQCFFAVIFDIT